MRNAFICKLFYSPAENDQSGVITPFPCALCIGLLSGLLKSPNAYAVSCPDTRALSEPLSEEGIQTDIINQLCRHSISLAKRFNSRNPRVVLLHKERWQQLPDCSTTPDIHFSAMAQNGKLPLLVSCPDHDGASWKQRLAARVDFDVSVLMAGRDINRGDVLSGPGLKKSTVLF